MIPRFDFEVTIRRETGSATDRYGNLVTSGAATETLTSAWLEQSTTAEDLEDRDTRVSSYLLVLPPEADLLATDTVIYNAESYRVAGKPRKVYNSRGLHHVEVTIELLEG